MNQIPRTPRNNFSLSIAGLGVAVVCHDTALLERLRRHYQAFLSSVEPQFEVKVLVNPAKAPGVGGTGLDPQVVFFPAGLQLAAPGFAGTIDERAGTARLSLALDYPLEAIDYFLRVLYAVLAFHSAGFLFHAAGIVRRSRAYLFFGHSGSGKTTIARLSSGDVVLNDDLVLLFPHGSGWLVHATPFWNPSQVLPTHQSAPLAGLYRLTQDRTVFLEKMGPAQALAEIVSNLPVITEDPARSEAVLVRGAQLLTTVPAYRLHFLPEASFWTIIDP